MRCVDVTICKGDAYGVFLSGTYTVGNFYSDDYHWRYWDKNKSYKRELSRVFIQVDHAFNSSHYDFSQVN